MSIPLTRRRQSTSGSFNMRSAILRLWCAEDVVLGGECKHLSHLAHGAADGSVPDAQPVFLPTRTGLDSDSMRGQPLPARQ